MPSAKKPLLGVALAASAALLTAGCQNQQSVASNPFAAADRVPPPATRIPASPVAQPYYQGADSEAAPPATFVAAPSAQQLQPSQPSNSLAAAAPPATFAAGENVIGLPTDNQPLRLGAPAQQPAAPQIAAAATTSAMAPLTAAAEPPPTSPEFSPLAAPTQLAWGGGSPPATAATPVVYTPAPRVRLPGYATPVNYEAAAASQPAAGPIGTVQITELPAARHQQPASATAGPAGDGFQPRGASPRSTPTPVTPSGFY